jgi:PAS domain S-box-containing protein
MIQHDGTELRKVRRKSYILQPAVALMNRLTYPRKFLLISVLFLGLLALIMYFLVLQLDESIDFTAKEKVGTRYLRPLVQVFRHAGEARRLARVYARGDRSSRPQLQRKLADIDEDFKAVEHVDRELGTSLNSTSKFQSLQSNWSFLKKEAFDPALDHADKLFVDFLGEIRRLYSHVGDESNLILDPDLDTYYLMDSILLKLHEGQWLLMRAAIESEDISFRKTMTPEERANFIVLLGAIRSNLIETRDNAERAFKEKNNPSGTARPRLQKPYDDFVLGTREFLDGLDRDLVQPKSPTVAPEILAAAVVRPLDMSFDLWNRATAELDELMDGRIAKYEGRKKIAWISTLLVLGLVGYLWLAFYAAVMGTVDNLEHASQRMLGADPTKEIVLETHDELGRVTKSFNAIAQRLRQEWEQATQDNARARAAEARLLESEERTRLIIQSALDAVITIDLEGRIVEWNPQASAIFGWPREEAVGKNLASLVIPERSRGTVEGGFKQFAATGEGSVLNRRIEITALRRGGAEFPVEVSIAPLIHGKGAAISAFVRDITDRKRGEEELKKAKDAAEMANHAKSEFLANMSHELRTPLNSIIGFSTVVLKGKGKHLPPQEATYLERILDNGKHLLGLINSILDLSKIEAGKVDLNVVPVALDALVRETLAQLEGRIVEKKITLVADLPPRIAPFPTDPDKLKQILINLVGNAIKFTEKGTVTVRVVVDPKTDVARRIDVIDTGVGIPRDMLSRVFDAFQQVDTGMSRKYEGTGLGLTISRSLSELLGCRIELESELGKGSTFSLHLLPVGPGQGATTRIRRPSDIHLDGREDDEELRDKLVLVIDDEDDSRVLLRQYLGDCGCRVAEARSGPEALDKARELKPDLITLDLMMPGMNGWETLRKLKADPELFEVPVVVVSIVASENRGTIFGAADLLNKPVSREELCSVLRRNVRPGKSKVLVVDDDADARQIIAEYLADEQAEIQTAADGKEALQRLQTFTPDLIILDLMMPVMDGVTFLDTVRRDPNYFSLPVVVATAKVLTLQEARQLETAVSVVLRKGDDLRADLGRVVRSLLRRVRKSAPAVEPAKDRIPVKVRSIVADLVPGFLDARRKEVGAIREALDRNEFETIRVTGHNMKGTGSSYGFPPITEIGRRLEEAAAARAREEIRRQVAALTDYLDRVDVLPE